MSQSEQQPLKRYTAEEFLALPDDGIRRELIDGIIYIKVEAIDDRPLGMAAPSPRHQAVSRELTGQLWLFLKGKSCDVFASPLDIQLSPDFAIDGTVVEPDIVVLCNLSKFDKNVYKDMPEFVIEILSPTTARVDKIVKMKKYEQCGIREYWIVDPIKQLVFVHLLIDGKYKITEYTNKDDSIPVMVLGDCVIDLTDVFAAVDRLG